MNNRSLPAKAGHQARKRFGQNFLHDGAVIDKIVAAIHPTPDDAIVEIGPGLGAITEPLLDSGARVTVVELDRDLIPVLRTKFFNASNFTVIEGDALKFDFAALSQEGPVKLVGNLPYNISTPLIFHLLEGNARIQAMHFMLQKEVVDRLAAKPGTEAYGRLSVMAQYHCRVDSLFNVGPGAFNPPPKVWSAIVRLMPYDEPPFPCRDARVLSRVVRQAFAMRRKTLRNCLKKEISKEALEGLAIDPQRRPETLSVEEYVRIANYLIEQTSDSAIASPDEGLPSNE